MTFCRQDINKLSSEQVTMETESNLIEQAVKPMALRYSDFMEVSSNLKMAL
jgi:hypothetical protein